MFGNRFPGFLHKRHVFIAVCLILYFALLTWISHARAPKPTSDPLFEPESETISEPQNILGAMLCSRDDMRNPDGTVTVGEGDVLYGPYMDMTAGEYRITVETVSQAPFGIAVTSDSGKNLLAEAVLEREAPQFCLSLSVDAHQVEFVLRGQNSPIQVCAVMIEPMETVSEP